MTQVAGPRQTQAVGHQQDTSAVFSWLAQVDLKQQVCLRPPKGAHSSRCRQHTLVGNFFKQASLDLLWSQISNSVSRSLSTLIFGVE